MNEPEDDGIHVHRYGVLCQGLLGAERGRLNTLVNDGHDVVDRRNDQEQPRRLDAAQFAGAQDDEFLPGVRHLQGGGDDDREEHKDGAWDDVTCRNKDRTDGHAAKRDKHRDQYQRYGSTDRESDQNCSL